MDFKRSSGVLLHVSSLPSYGGIGDLGPAAHEFVAFLAAAKQHVWQVLPLCPTGYGNSPYAGSSAFAGNPYLISLEFLSDWGWIDGERIGGLAGRSGNVDFDEVEQRKLPLALRGGGEFSRSRAATSRSWPSSGRSLRSFAGPRRAGWTTMPSMPSCAASSKPARGRSGRSRCAAAQPEALAEDRRKAWARAGAGAGAAVCLFAAVERAARGRGARSGIRILGDVAIFVNMDSADVWVHPELFELDEELKPVRIAGVPPDYFSPTGQRWGNPLYRWDVLEERGFDWWIERIRAPASFTTLSGWITSAASRRTGRFRPRKRRR